MTVRSGSSSFSSSSESTSSSQSSGGSPSSSAAAGLSDSPPPEPRSRVELYPHDPAWAARAEAEIAHLTGALGEALVGIAHIGSTSIPGIVAKPIIDLLPIVRSLEAADAREPAVRALGYDWRGEYGIAGRRFCTKSDERTGRRLFNVHIFASGSPDVTRHIAFRDYLRAHPDEARAYEAEKQRAAALHPWDVFAYNDEKDGWIRAAEQRALAWAAITARATP